jgi:hypothetical protein
MSTNKPGYMRDYMRKRLAWIDAYKSERGCAFCGEHDPTCLDFHHTGDKEHTISHMAYKCFSIEDIMIEIEKCIVVCANCHRKLHYYGDTFYEIKSTTKGNYSSNSAR